MSEEDFLRRWFRRKREAGAAHDQPVESEAPMQAGPLSYDEGDVAAEPKIDLSALPPIDSITCASDITPFLRKGIPEELTRAALRRAWSTDPAIRDFIGLAENAWDFNDPDAMPGFGPLDWSAEQIQNSRWACRWKRAQYCRELCGRGRTGHRPTIRRFRAQVGVAGGLRARPTW